jgi:2-(1,2-epoxy-1,2-dihydrophenyl)acetyl-CoA isomerase
MSQPLVTIEDQGDRLIVVNCNTARRNALSPDYYQALASALKEATSQPRIKSVILTAKSPFFCSGGDLNLLAERQHLSLEDRASRIEALHDLIRLIRNCPKPVIAAVEGGAAGAGLSIALACDFIVAAVGAKFSAAYVKAGLVPDGGLTSALTQLLPRALVSEICLTGRAIAAERFYDLGAINRLCPAGQTLSVAQDIATGLAAGPTVTQGKIKALLVSAQFTDADAQLDVERDTMAQAIGAAEAIEGIAAFLEKRAPIFRTIQGK